MDAIVAWAEGALGCPILRAESLLPPDRRSRVLRCFTDDGTVILKEAPDAREGAGLRFLAGTGLAPTYLAGDPARGLVLMEDLEGERLDALLLRPEAPAAVACLVQHAQTMGRMHAVPVDPGPTTRLDLDRIGAAWHIDIEPGASDALELEATSYTQGDVGPDNAMVVGDGVRLFDFEIGEARHPLTDAVAWHLGFPFGADTGVIPTEVIAQMDAAYEAALGQTFTARQWGCAYVVQLLGRLDRFHAWDVMTDDWSWGRASGRQRLLALLGSRPPEAPMAKVLDDLEKRLRGQWSDSPTSLPVFPAFAT